MSTLTGKSIHAYSVWLPIPADRRGHLLLIKVRQARYHQSARKARQCNHQILQPPATVFCQQQIDVSKRFQPVTSSQKSWHRRYSRRDSILNADNLKRLSTLSFSAAHHQPRLSMNMVPGSGSTTVSGNHETSVHLLWSTKSNSRRRVSSC